MLRSLLIKALLLGITVSLLIWMGRPTPPERELRASHSVTGVKAAAVVSSLTESQSGAESRTTSPLSDNAIPRSATAKVDLNSATIEQLQRLPGIGPVLAERIVTYRNNNGLYDYIEQLLEVKGIGQIRLERLRPLLILSKRSTQPRSTQRPGQETLPHTEGTS